MKKMVNGWFLGALMVLGLFVAGWSIPKAEGESIVELQINQLDQWTDVEGDDGHWAVWTGFDTSYATNIKGIRVGRHVFFPTQIPWGPCVYWGGGYEFNLGEPAQPSGFAPHSLDLPSQYSGESLPPVTTAWYSTRWLDDFFVLRIQLNEPFKCSPATFQPPSGWVAWGSAPWLIKCENGWYIRDHPLLPVAGVTWFDVVVSIDYFGNNSIYITDSGTGNPPDLSRYVSDTSWHPGVFARPY